MAGRPSGLGTTLNGLPGAHQKQKSDFSQINVPMLHVVLHLLVTELPANLTLEGEDGVL